MARFGNKILKTVFVFTFICGSAAYAATQTQTTANTHAHSALQTLETKTTDAMGWVDSKTDIVRKKWQRAGIDSKIQAFQHKARPLGQKLSAKVSPKTEPVFKAVNEGERRMSVPAIFLILVFGGIFVLMGLSGPSSRLGGRH